MKTIQGEVLLPFQGHWPTATAERSTAHQIAVADFFKLQEGLRQVKAAPR